MPARPAAPPAPPKREGELATGIVLGLGIPVVATGFGGIAGFGGFLASVAILTIAAGSVSPSLRRGVGILTGLGIAFAFCVTALAIVMQGFS